MDLKENLKMEIRDNFKDYAVKAKAQNDLDLAISQMEAEFWHHYMMEINKLDQFVTELPEDEIQAMKLSSQRFMAMIEDANKHIKEINSKLVNVESDLDQKVLLRQREMFEEAYKNWQKLYDMAIGVCEYEYVSSSDK